MQSKLAKELSVIIALKVIAIAVIWKLFFSAANPVVEPVKNLF